MGTEEDLKQLVRDFFKILDRVEESDGGRAFRPTYITSCRTFDLLKLEQILGKMKEIVNE